MPDLTPKQQVEQVVAGWIKEGSLPEERRTEMVNLLTADDKLATSFANSSMLRANYSQKTAELARQREDAVREVQAERARIEEARRVETAELERLRKIERDKQTVEAELAAYRQMVADYEMEDRVKKPVQPQPQPQPVQAPLPGATAVNNQNPNYYVGREEARNYITELVQTTSDAMRVSAEHQRLFGQPLDDDIMAEALNARQQVRPYWETKYNVPAKRAELAEAQRRAERDQMRAELKAELLQEFGQNPMAIMGNGISPAVAEKNLVFDTYASKRMDGFRGAPSPPEGGTNGQSTVTGQPPPRAIPEKIPDLAGRFDRVNEAVREYNSNFDVYGNPLKR